MTSIPHPFYRRFGSIFNKIQAYLNTGYLVKGIFHSEILVPPTHTDVLHPLIFCAWCLIDLHIFMFLRWIDKKNLYHIEKTPTFSISYILHVFFYFILLRNLLSFVYEIISCCPICRLLQTSGSANSLLKDSCDYSQNTQLDRWTLYLTDGHPSWWIDILFSWFVYISNIFSLNEIPIINIFIVSTV